MTEPYDTAATPPALDIQPPAPGNGAHRAGGASPAPDTSPLGDLRKLRERRAERNFIDLRVPGWGEDPEEDPRVSIYVRCRPIKPSELQAIRDRRVPKGNGTKAKRNDWVDLVNADGLIATCLEVWAQTGDPRDPAELDESARLSLHPESPYGAKTRFDGDLADALGMDRNMDGSPPTAVQVVMWLFLHEGNVARAAGQLIEHSNLGAEREPQDFTAT